VRVFRQFGQIAKADVEGDVESPAVDAKRQIRPDDRVLGSIQIVADGGEFEIQFGQAFDIGPQADAFGVAGIKIEPRAILDVLIDRSLMNRRVDADVVENAVEHQTAMLGVKQVCQADQIVFRAKLGRDLHVIRGIVFVVACGKVNWIQIQNVDPKIEQIVEF